MKIIGNIYASYYFFYIAQNKFVRPTIFRHYRSDAGQNAFWLLGTCEFLLLFDMLLLINNYLHFNFLIMAIVAIIIFIPLVLFQQKYLISRIENRREILENFRELPFSNKFLWNTFSFFLVVFSLIILLLILYCC